MVDVQFKCNPVPVLGEYIDSRRVVGAVGYIYGLQLRHQTQEEPSNSLLALWKSVDRHTCHLDIGIYGV